jgi:tetratricopeptide (TPR) repeat protein
LNHFFRACLLIILHLTSLFIKTNEHEKAAEAFRKYLQSNPNDSEVVAMLSTSLISMDQKDEGLKLLVPFLESNQATDEMRLTAANIYLERNEPQQAIDILGSISKLWPEDVGVATLMSQANQRVGNIEAAKKFSDIVAAGQPDLQKIDARIGDLQRGIDDTAENNYQLGHILLHKRSREEGIIWLKQAITRDPQYVKAYEDIVVYFTRTNQTEMATRYQQFVNSLKGTP